MLGAFIGGILTLLSPCSVMLLPSFFSYAFSSPAKLLGRSGLFFLGLITTLVPLGVLAGSVGAFFTLHRAAMITVLSVIIILLGVLMVMNVPLPGAGRLFAASSHTGSAQIGAAAARQEASDKTSSVAVYLLGTVFGVAGVCAGPILGAVLTMAALSSNALYGGLVLVIYAAGMALPLVILSALWQRFPFSRRLVRPRLIHLGPLTTPLTGVVGGLFTAALGVFLLLGRGAEYGGFLSSTQQIALESHVQRATASIPDVVVVAVVIVVAAVAWGLSRWHARRG